MNLNTLTQGEPWMTPEEQDLNRELIRAFADRLESGGVTQTPFVTLRVNDVIATWLLARRLESALAPDEGETPPCPSPTQAGAIGKCRERLRKAMKELENVCAKTGVPAREGFVDQMHRIVKKVRATGLVGDGPFCDGVIFGTTETEPTNPEAPGNPIPANKVPTEAAPNETPPGKNAPKDSKARAAQPAETPTVQSPRDTPTPMTASTETTPRATPPVGTTPRDNSPGIRSYTTRATAGKNHPNQNTRAAPCTLPPEVLDLPGTGASSTPLPSLQRPWDPG